MNNEKFTAYIKKVSQNKHLVINRFRNIELREFANINDTYVFDQTHEENGLRARLQITFPQRVIGSFPKKFDKRYHNIHLLMKKGHGKVDVKYWTNEFPFGAERKDKDVTIRFYAEGTIQNLTIDDSEYKKKRSEQILKSMTKPSKSNKTAKPEISEWAATHPYQGGSFTPK